MPKGVYPRKKAEPKDAPSPQKRGAKKRVMNLQRERERQAFRRGRKQGWRDVLSAYLSQDGEEFQDWLYTLTGHDE